jgi:hypothetical protein
VIPLHHQRASGVESKGDKSVPNTTPRNPVGAAFRTLTDVANPMTVIAMLSVAPVREGSMAEDVADAVAALDDSPVSGQS